MTYAGVFTNFQPGRCHAYISHLCRPVVLVALPRKNHGNLSCFLLMKFYALCLSGRVRFILSNHAVSRGSMPTLLYFNLSKSQEELNDDERA